MTSILEYVRTLHADMERCELEIQTEILTPATHPRQAIVQQQFIASKLAEVQEKSKALLDLYTSSEEISALRREGAAKAVNSFYGRLTEVREYHKRHPLKEVPIECALQHSDPKKSPPFSGEESWGRCVDLVEMHRTYVDLVGVFDGSLTYVKYLTKRLTNFAEVPPAVRQSPEFAQYLTRVAGTLRASHMKAYPLDNIMDNITDNEARVCHWADVSTERLRATIQRQEKKMTTSPEELEAEERREVEAMLKAFETKNEHPATEEQQDNAIQPKQALAGGSNQELDWQGNPIATWLSKLHGLKVKLVCDICNKTYRGPQVFEEHFHGSLHTHYLAKLGIPQNTKHFSNVSNPVEAKALWARLQKDSGAGIWRSEAEEFEDEEGHVFTKGTFEDMKRQGLL